MTDKPYIDGQGRKYSFGEFLPPEMSPFGYNETLALDFFPLSKDEAEQKGFLWYVPQKKMYQATLVDEKIPDTIQSVNDNVLNEVFLCEHAPNNEPICNQQCTTVFRITKDEFSFYKKMNIPLPHLCPNCRHYERLPMLMRPFKLWHRTCMNMGCKNEFETSYAPDRPEKLYCESCYQKEVL